MYGVFQLIQRAILLRRSLPLVAALVVGHAALGAEPVITEFLASNQTNLVDMDGSYSDWVEIHNPGSSAVDLSGWYLTDSANNLTRWPFPAVSVPAGGYLVVFASGKNRANPGAELHTNFSLSAGGEYLALIKPDGRTVAFEYAPQFPAQTSDVSYGVTVRADGSVSEPTLFSAPTPGQANAVSAAPALAERVAFSRSSGVFTTEFALQLSGAAPGQVIRYVLSANDGDRDGAAELTAGSPAYTAPLIVTGSSIVRAAVFAEDGNTRGPVAVAHFTKLAADVAAFASKLPVLVIDSLGTGPLVKDGVDHPAWMYVYGARSTETPVFASSPEIVTPLTATVRGSSSALFPKKGYNLKLADVDGTGQPPSLLGLPAHEKWALVAPWKFDQGYVNNSFMYTLSNRLGRWAPRTSLAEVFFQADGTDLEAKDYAGIYVVTDRIEVSPERVAVAELRPGDVTGSALTGGYIFKLDTPDDDEFSWKTSREIPAAVNLSLVLVAPKAESVAPAQRTYLVDYVQQAEDALFADRDSGFARRTYLEFIDRGSWVDHHILNTFAANPDALERSAYFTKNRDGRLQAGPVWDFDRALGSYEDERSYRPDVWSGVGAIDVWHSGWWGVLARDPEFQQDWVDRWQALRRTTLSNPSLLDLVEALTAGLDGGAAARDAQKWPDNASPYGSFAGQIQRMKGWVTQRAEWIDAQFAAPPVVTPEGDLLVVNAPAGAKLIYTTDGSDPRSLGGEIAPNARVSLEAMTFPAGTNLHVRCYRDDMKDVFPGSPWSSAVGAAASSPLAPAARLLNVSTRALVNGTESPVVSGVVVADATSKNYLFRSVGPGLAAFGATGVLPDPRLRVLSSAGSELFVNNDWQSDPAAAQVTELSRSVGAFPLAAGSLDAAIVGPLSVGASTVETSSPSGQAGGVLAELYELDDLGRTANVSSRAYVRGGEEALLGGFVVEGPAYKRVLVRAVGPSLTALGFTNALADSVLTIYRGAEVVATNDRWDAGDGGNAVSVAGQRVGAFPLVAGSEDAALLITLPPGAYTIEVKGKAGSEGLTLLEFYDLP